MAKQTHIFNMTVLFCLALVLRLTIIFFHGFDGLYGQDAFAYYNFATDLLYFVQTGNAPPPFFWSIGYPLQIAIGFGIFGISESVALGLNILMGSGLSALVYMLALYLKIRPPYAFFAGLLMAFSGQALQSSLVIMSDIPALFWAVLSGIALLRYIENSKRRWFMLCCFALSLACITRWIYLILPPLFALTLLLHWRHNIRWKDLLTGLFVALIPIVPQVIYNQVNPPTLLNHSWVQGWHPLNAFSQDFVNIDGTFQYENINALFYAYPIYDLSYLSPLLTVFVIIGLFAVIWSRSSRNIFLLGWLCLPYLFLAGIPYQNIRFTLIVFPIVAVIIGYGVQTIGQWQNPLRWLGIGLALISFVHTADNGFDYANTFVEHHQSEKAVVTWLTDRLSDDVTLYTLGSTLTLEHYTDYRVIEIYYETPDTLNQRWYRGRSDHLLLNLWQIENQWQGREPQTNYHWFRDERGLTQLGTFRNLTLFEVNP